MIGKGKPVRSSPLRGIPIGPNDEASGPELTDVDTSPQLSRKANPFFARHETFHPRFGWIKKGFDKALQNPSVFTQDDAPAVLGVGKNMVQAIRYWTMAFKVLEEVQQAGTKARTSRPTRFGQRLLEDFGLDPYLENPASLWLLHWNLIRQPNYATTWDYVFNSFRRSEFTAEDLINSLTGFTQQQFPSSRVVQASLKKDVSCLLRMYVEERGSSFSNEESIDSPFVELSLIRSSTDGRFYYFNMGNKPTLDPEVLVVACLQYAADIGQTANSLSLSRLLYDPGSPGLVFKLTESSLYAALDDVASRFPKISISDTAGLVQLVYSGRPFELSEVLLDQYYKRKRS